MVKIHDSLPMESVSFSNRRISFGGLEKAYKSVDLNGFDERTHYTSIYANYFMPSPDNKWLAFTELFKVYLTPFIQTGKALDLSNGTSAYPVKLVSQEAGTNVHWSNGSDKLHWNLGDNYFSTDVKSWFNLQEKLKRQSR